MVLVGVCSIRLMIQESGSLKEKRHTLKSIIERLKSRFNVSVAETGLNDKWQSAEIGVAFVSNDRVHIEKTINNVIDFVDNDYRVEVTDYSIDMY
ncbi:MAG TPA: DUF503 domain-containing protein [Clostridiaceae bacterium]|nr:DUF503 domain-containing protein [Clostridiaceae bacterium]